MEINLLKEELKDLQIRYKNVLLKAKDNIFRTDTNAIVDEINVFGIKTGNWLSLLLETCTPVSSIYLHWGLYIRC